MRCIYSILLSAVTGIFLPPGFSSSIYTRKINHKVSNKIGLYFSTDTVTLDSLKITMQFQRVSCSIPLKFDLGHNYVRGARWLSGRVSDSGARGPGFETYRRRVVSLSKTLYSPKVMVNYPGSDGSVPT